MDKTFKVLVVGCGRMGSTHAEAYNSIDEFELVGLVDQDPARTASLKQTLNGKFDTFTDFDAALKATKPDVICVTTLPDSHEKYAIAALEAGCHLFLEKPMAPTVEGSQRIAAAAKKAGRKVLVGYGCRHHPAWIKFVEVARTLGKPLVMRMNLNQQLEADTWRGAKGLLKSCSPLVDCGVHYVDIMCQMTKANPVSVSAIGVRLADDISKDMYNYGQLQVRFDDGSVGWYEAGWGPMISETAFFVKDVFGPKGSVSIISSGAERSKSGDINSHSKAESLLIHYSDLGPDEKFSRKDEELETEPVQHNDIAVREQRYLLKAINENIDLTEHLQDAVNSMKIVLAADKSVRTGKTVELEA